MKNVHWWKKKKEEIPYTASEFPYFLPDWIKFDTFYFQIFCYQVEIPDQCNTFIYEFRWRLWLGQVLQTWHYLYISRNSISIRSLNQNIRKSKQSFPGIFACRSERPQRLKICLSRELNPTENLLFLYFHEKFSLISELSSESEGYFSYGFFIWTEIFPI